MSCYRPKTIKFVKSSTVDDFLSLSACNSESSAGGSSQELLTGNEARDFYKKVISEESPIIGYKNISQISSSATDHIPVRKQRLQHGCSLADLRTFTERDQRLFFRAATHGDVHSMRQFLCNYKDVCINMKDEHGWTPLMCAAAEGKLEAVKFIIANGANTKLCDSNGRSAESLAAMFRHYDVRECLTNLRMQTRSDNSLKRTGSAAVDLKNCSDCGSSYTDEAHFSSIVHIISTSKPIEAPGYSIPEWNIGYQMLQKTGWKETQGLGKCGEGKRYPVRTALKRDRKGLGLEKNIVKRVTHPEAHLAVPHSPSSRKLVVKEREEQLAKERRIAIKIRQEFMQ